MQWTCDQQTASNKADRLPADKHGALLIRGGPEKCAPAAYAAAVAVCMCVC